MTEFSVVSPMKHPNGFLDDTETGIPQSSSILAYAKRTFRPQRDAQDELHHTTVQYSKLNERALEIVASHKNHVPLTQHETEDEPWITVSFVTNIALGGKTAFTVHHRMSETVGTLRDRLIASIGVRPTGHVSLHRSDTDEVLPSDKTLMECGFRFPPTLRLHHYLREVYATVPKPLKTRIALPWGSDMTLTDALMHIYKRLQPRSMHDVRLSVVRRDPLTGETVRCDVQEAAKVCMLPREPLGLPLSHRVCDVLPRLGPRDPTSVHFLRSKDGFPLVYSFPVEGGTTLRQLMQAVHSSGGLSRASLETFGGGDAYAERALSLTEECDGHGDSDSPFDDEDEEIYLVSKPNNLHQSAAAALEGVTSRVVCSQTLSSLNDSVHHDDLESGRPLYQWTAEDWCTVFHQGEHCDVSVVCQTLTQYVVKGLILSYAPPPSVMYRKLREPPRFVTIESDYRVPHLTDLGIWPGVDILCEVYDPLKCLWSGEAESLMCKVSNIDSPVHELVTLKCTETNRVVRVPCTPTTAMDDVLTMLWMATGALPMFTVLLTEHGRLLAPFETLASVNLLPQTTLFYAPRPRSWLRESLPDVRRLSSASSVPEPPPRQ